MGNAISAHGIKIEVQMTPGSTFSAIGELGGAITPPPITRNTFDVTTHNDDVDSYIAGVLRRGNLTFMINFISSGQFHDANSGLLKLEINNTKTGYRMTYPDGDQWIFSGFVVNFAPAGPVDGAYTAAIGIRPDGLQLIIPSGQTAVVLGT